MGYKKFLVDNTTCSRRFHVTFDDESPSKEYVELPCPHCGKVIFSAADHPAVSMQREENLVKTVTLSENLITGCDFTDQFSAETIPALKGKTPKPLYKE